MVEHLTWRRDVARVERAKLGEPGRSFVESHAIYDLSEELGILAPQRYTPFPVLEYQPHSNELRHFAGERHSAAGVLSHHAIPLRKIECEPVLAGLSLLIHGIETGGRIRRELRREAFAIH